MSNVKIYSPQDMLLGFDENFPLDANCYAYALNIPYLRNQTPGYLSREFDQAASKSYDLSAKGLDRYLKKDGLRSIKSPFHADRHVIAAFCDEGNDYHFLRHHNDDGVWSHKFSGETASALDDIGCLIVDPSAAEFFHYSTFVGLYEVPKRGLEYLPIHGGPK